MTDTTTWPTIKDAKPAPAPVYRWDDHMQMMVPCLPAELIQATDKK